MLYKVSTACDILPSKILKTNYTSIYYRYTYVIIHAVDAKTSRGFSKMYHNIIIKIDRLKCDFGNTRTSTDILLYNRGTSA